MKRENIISISEYFIYYLLGVMQNYHVTIWCEMQTSIWMIYSDSTHFSDWNSYKILCIPSYGLKDINFARSAYLLEFRKTGNRDKIVSHRGGACRGWCMGPICQHRGMKLCQKKCCVWLPPRRLEPQTYGIGTKGSDHYANRSDMKGIVSQSLYSEVVSV
jgi:hypothetical protein